MLVDSVDNLGDAFTYALSLYAVKRGLLFKARVALLKGLLILVAVVTVSMQVIVKVMNPQVPIFQIMGVFSLLGLLGNSLTVFLLWRHRHGDINMRSVWECSRNDALANISVFVAAGGVWLTRASWPDFVVALGLMVVLLHSSLKVIVSALREIKRIKG